MWSISLRFFSSGTRQSKQRLPASMWKIGISFRAAATAERPLFVSPRMSSASGSNASSSPSLRAITSPICAPTGLLLDARYASGAGSSSSSKKMSDRRGS